MSREKLRIANTETDNLLGNLRGEISEIVTCWILMQQFIVSGNRLRSDDISKDLSNPDLTFVYVLNDKLEDDLVARLSELAEAKIGRLNFYFAAEKLGKFRGDFGAGWQPVGRTISNRLGQSRSAVRRAETAKGRLVGLRR